MLPDPRDKLAGTHREFASVEIGGGKFDALGTQNVRTDSGQTQAALFVNDRLVLDYAKLGIDENVTGVIVARIPSYEHAPGQANLGRSQAQTLFGIHQFDHA